MPDRAPKLAKADGADATLGDVVAQLKQVASDLEMLTRLVAVGVLQTGHSQHTLAAALGMDQSTISRLITKARDPGKKARKKR